MEAILEKLSVPDNDVIARGTSELREAIKIPGAVSELCAILGGSSSAQTRQYAALLLRKRFARAKNWNRLPSEDRESIKRGCLLVLSSEADKSVRHSVAQLVAVVARYELAKSSAWPDLMRFLVGAMSSDDAGGRQLGTYCLSVLSETAGDQLKLELPALAPLLEKALRDETDRDAGFHAVLSIARLVGFVGSDQLHLFQPLVAHVVAFVRALAAASDERAADAMEVFDELFECEVRIVVPHVVGAIVELCLTFAAEERLGDAVRVKAIAVLGRLTRLKKKSIVKNRLCGRMIEVLFSVVCVGSGDLDGGGEEEEEPLSQESSSPAICACQALDAMALNLPPERFMPGLLKLVEPALASSEPRNLKGAYYALAVCAEGCSEHIRANYMVQFLGVVGRGIRHEEGIVRNAALYALGQFSEFLQPEISGYAEDVLPVLLGCLDVACAGGGASASGLDRIFYALEMFSENLEGKLVPYLPELLRRLLPMAAGGEFPVRVRQLAISGIGSAASAVGVAIVPYFDEVIGRLKPYLSADGSGDDDADEALLKQSMATLGTVAKAVGPASFAPALAEECCRLAMSLVERRDDPDVRKCAFALFASVGFVAKDSMSAVLPKIVPLMLLSVSSKEGISLEFKDDDALLLPELSDDDDEEEEDEISLGDDDSFSELERVKALKVENAFVEEKEQAILSLKEMCVDTGPAFASYLPGCFEEVWKQLGFMDDDVRKAAVEALSHFAIAACLERQRRPGEFEGFARLLLPRLCSMVREDEEVAVVCVCLEMMSELLKRCKGALTAAVVPAVPADIVDCVEKVMRSECACMDADDEEADDDDEGEEEHEAEQDELLFECAGELLPGLGAAMDPQSFLPHFERLFPLLLKKARKRATAAERSFSAGSLAECMAPLRGGALEKFAPSLVQVFLELRADEDRDVRNNAIFGIGELALHGGPFVHQHFHRILVCLSEQLAREDDPRCVDQIVGAVCRMIVANRDLVPLDEVFPVVFRNLPLKEDDEEYETVFRCFEALYPDCHQAIRANMAKVLEVCAIVLGGDEGDADGGAAKAKPMAAMMTRRTRIDFPEDFDVALKSLNPEMGSKLLEVALS